MGFCMVKACISFDVGCWTFDVGRSSFCRRVQGVQGSRIRVKSEKPTNKGLGVLVFHSMFDVGRWMLDVNGFVGLKG